MLSRVAIECDTDLRVDISHVFAAAAAATLLVMAVGPTQAAMILLHDTGVHSDGTPLANDATDVHSTLISASLGDVATLRVATLPNGFPIGPWVGDDTGSAWVGPTRHGQLGGPTDLRVEMTGSAAAVPVISEPANWALMLAGLGGMGFVLRTARKPFAA